jgi:anaphase-promoting complex subunit 8
MDASSNMTTSGMSMSMDTANDQSLCTQSNLPSTPQRFSTVKTSGIVWDLEEARSNLRNATQILSKYGLKLASRWAAEQLNSLAPPKQGSSAANVSPSALHSEFLKSGNDLEYYAKSVMDVGDYHRAAFILSANPDDLNGASISVTGKKRIGTSSGDLVIHPPRDSLTSYGLYLRAYSLYMAGERRKEEEVLELR